MSKPILTPAQVKTLESALYDLQMTEPEMDVLRETGADLSDIEPVRNDLRKNIMAYLAYAKNAKKQP
jgi:hypothetical protein